MVSVALGTEDELSEAIGLRLLAEQGGVLDASLLLRKSGFGYLRSKMDSWRQLAQYQPVVLITDLDRVTCPVLLLRDWVGANPIPDSLLVRIAVREVESWLLADHDAMRALLGSGRLPPHPDELPDPKQHLLRLAKRASRSIRQDLLREEGSVSAQGLGYNARLTDLVRSGWSPEKGAERSPSLARARRRIAELAERLR